MTGALHALGVDGLRLALLVLGHVLADFALQGDRMVARKREPRVLAAHGLFVLGAAIVTYFPLLTPPALVVLVAVALLHVGIDRVKLALEARRSRPLGHFIGDQLAHLLVLLVAWRLLARPGVTAPLPGALGSGLVVEALTTWAVWLAALVFVHKGGTALVRGLLARYPAALAEGDGAEALRMGRAIGTLERWLAVPLVALGQWGALGLVLAAKSIARFPELSKRPFAEYYLIGTLASLLVAVVAGGAVAWLV